MNRDELSAASRFLGAMNAAPLRVLVLLVLFTAPAVNEAFHLSSLADADVWWHLRTGLWMMQNHAVPHNGLFSQYDSLPWTASSWGFDILLAAAYRLIGLRSLPLVSMGLQVAFAITVFLLARGSPANFWPPVFLLACSQYAAARLQPQPISCSMLLFALELAVLFESRRTGKLRPLLWLPLLFLAWATLDITFVYGLFALTLLLVAAAIERLCRRSQVTWFEGHMPAMPVLTLAALTAASVAAVMLSPYSYHVYGTVFKNAASSAYDYVGELHALNFRQARDYVLLLVAMAAFLSLGRRRSRDLFKVLLMIASLAISFAIQRDHWVVVLSAVAVIADAFASPESQAARKRQYHVRPWEKPFTAALVLVVIVAAALRIPSGSEPLIRTIGSTFPVQAADYIRQNHLPHPLFNDYQWGSFLTWYLPEYPVAIDARTDLYGDALNLEYFALINNYVSLEADPSFARARTVLLKRNSGLAESLGDLPEFSAVYTDDLATVVVRKNQP